MTSNHTYLHVTNFRIFPHKTAHDIAEFHQVVLVSEVFMVTITPMNVLLYLRQVQTDRINRIELQSERN